MISLRIYDISSLRVKEMGLEGMDWVDLAQDKNKWWAVVNAVMNLLVP